MKETLEKEYQKHSELQIIQFSLPESINSQKVVKTQDSNVFKLPQMVAITEKVDLQKTEICGSYYLNYIYKTAESHEIKDELIPLTRKVNLELRTTK